MIRALAAFAVLLAGSAGAQTVPGQLHNAAAIADVLAKLPQAAQTSPPLTIVQIGDSHTAGDMLTNGWRSRWQAEYGAGGRGISPVGRPYQGYLTWGVTARQSPEWVANAVFGKQHVADGPRLGLSGFTQTAAHDGAWVSLSADTPDFAFDDFTLCGLSGPGMGAVRILLTPVPDDPAMVAPEFSFAADRAGAVCFHVGAASPATLATITTLDDRPVSLTSWQSTRAHGLVLSSLGVVGARMGHLARNDDAVDAQEWQVAHPDMVVIAFGTNEGFDPALKLDEAEATLRGQIARLRRQIGRNVPILLLTPPDAASNRPEVALPGLPETVNCGGGWYVPGHLAQIHAMQLRLARELNLAVWDWQAAMGGPCSTMAWVANGLQRGDHVHFSKDGGRMLGEALAADLDAARAQ